MDEAYAPVNSAILNFIFIFMDIAPRPCWRSSPTIFLILIVGDTCKGKGSLFWMGSCGKIIEGLAQRV